MASTPSDIPVGTTASPDAGGLSRGEFADRFRESWKALWCIAASVCRDRSSAEDAVQEAAVIAMGKLGEFSPGTSFVAWMGQIVRYVALNAGRKSARRETILRSGSLGTGGAAHGSGNSVQNSPQNSVEHWGLGAEMAAALETLDPTAKACLLLRVVGGMSYEQISAALGIPEGTAMSHVFRARKAMAGRVAPPKKGEAS